MKETYYSSQLASICMSRYVSGDGQNVYVIYQRVLINHMCGT